MDGIPINIPPDAWEDVSEHDDGTKLLAAVKILGVRHYIEAFEVRYDADGVQQPTGPFTDRFNNLCVDFDVEDDFQTVKINGRDYCLFMCPAEVL